ncbi:hypothetical protein cypCar_00041532 [Cyprinus carpio]|nr:hypothetical protein cypCar_00041532 [Cyprinus carpio]
MSRFTRLRDVVLLSDQSCLFSEEAAQHFPLVFLKRAVIRPSSSTSSWERNVLSGTYGAEAIFMWIETTRRSCLVPYLVDRREAVRSTVKRGTRWLMCSVPIRCQAVWCGISAAEQNKHYHPFPSVVIAGRTSCWLPLADARLRRTSLHPAAPSCPLSSPMEINPPRARLYFLLAWFHAVIQERLRYAPLGWSKKYEFGESDLRSACDTVDTWLDDTAKGRQNISPDKIPWAALRTLMAQSIYGGRIDNEFDQRLLNTFLERLFTTSSFDSEFKLALKVDGHKDIKMPDGIRREEFIHWVEMLPDTQTPSWLGLPSNAEKVLLTTQGIDMMGKLLKMQMLEDEDDLAYETEKKQRSTSSSDAQPAWMRTLHTTARNWLQLIPESVNPLKRTVENIKDPLFRFFEREVKMGSRMLQDVRQDLTDVVHVCEGKKKQTNDLRTLINDLVKGILPRSWSRYTVPAVLTVIQWVADFSERIKQLQQISQGAASGGAKELKVTLPVYLNFTRADLIFTVDLDIATKEDPHHFYERGVAILCTE